MTGFSNIHNLSYMKKRVALKDIAGELGVSTALVSYVLNGKDKEARVGKEMVRKIKQTAKKLNYQPNLIARGLKYGRTNTLGLIVADISNPFFASLARIIENEAGRLGYTVIIGSSDENVQKAGNLIETFLARQVDGLIITPVDGFQPKLKDLQSRNVPSVLIDRSFSRSEGHVVMIDNQEISKKAVELLIKNCYRKIGMIAYETRLSHMVKRVEGYKLALKENGIAFNEELLKKVSFEIMDEEVDESIHDLLFNKSIDGLFCATNSISIAALKVINKLNIKVPDQLGIVCFDQSEAYDFFYSPITYVKQDMDGIGGSAVRLLLSQLEMSNMELQKVSVPASLIIQDSSGGLAGRS